MRIYKYNTRTRVLEENPSKPTDIRAVKKVIDDGSPFETETRGDEIIIKREKPLTDREKADLAGL